MAFNAATDGGDSSGTTLTFSHTVSAGSNRLLVVNVFGDTANDRVTGVTYAGVAMTLLDKFLPAPGTSRWQYMFYLIAPATGANNVVVTCGVAPDLMSAEAADYTDVAQTSPVDISGKNVTVNSFDNTLTTSVTTTTDNCWTVLCAGGYNANNPPVAGAGSTRRTFEATFGALGTFDSNGAITPAGSYSMTTTRSPNPTSNIAHIVAAFKPVAAGGDTLMAQTLLMM